MSEYVKAADRVLARAKRGIGLAVIDHPCHTCRYHRAGFVFDTCANPIVLLAASQAESDYDRKALRESSVQRGKDYHRGEVVCGPDATLWERKLTFWERVFGEYPEE